MADNLTASSASSPGTTSRGINITLWVLQGLLALAFVFSGVGKLTGSPQAVTIFQEMGTASWMPYIIGVLEIIGAVALLVRRTAGAAALGFVALMVGAVLSHVIWGGPPALAIVLLILSAVVAYGRRDSIAELLSGAGR